MLNSTVKGSGSPLESLVDAERAFAKASIDQGTDAAFLAFLGQDSVLFKPGPVDGREWTKSHPFPEGLLTWEPAYADISMAGDLGYTTGPYEWRTERSLDAVPAGYGHYVSLWRRQADGTWKVEVDIGTPHAQPSAVAAKWSPATAPVPNGKAPDGKALKVMLLDADRALAAKAAEDGNLAAYKNALAETARLYRVRAFPVVGKQAALEALKKGPKVVEWRPEQSGVAKSKEFGYTIGSYYATGAAADGSDEEGAYVRIWKRDGGGTWRVVLDITNPTPAAG